MRGFSLVELSIVLVILGLLTGGILAGQSLIRASELRAVSTEYQRYAAAVNTFRDKYYGIPGDFSNATRFWNRQTATADCVSNSGLGAAGSPGTCDGNGNGAFSLAAGVSQSGEIFQFWRHLALAGLIEGSYTGLAGAADLNQSVIGSNTPASKLSNAGWSARGSGSSSISTGDTQMYAGIPIGNYFEFGTAATNSYTFNKALRPEEAWNIDTKLDDGKPTQGIIIARFWNNECAAADDGTHANNDLVASYKLSDSSIQCALYFARQF